jgi:hypothetical protein
VKALKVLAKNYIKLINDLFNKQAISKLFMIKVYLLLLVEYLLNRYRGSTSILFWYFKSVIQVTKAATRFKFSISWFENSLPLV